MAAKSVFQSPVVNSIRQRLVIHLLLLCVFLNLMECMHALDSVQALNGLRMDLVHIDSLLFPNITSTERLKRAVQRSQERLEKLQIMSAGKLHSDYETNDIQSPVSAGSGEFLIQMAIGTPVLSFSAIIDTGSDLIWTQCKPCTDCYQQPTPMYDPSLSSTYSTLPCTNSICQPPPIFSCGNNGVCNYNYTYGEHSFTQGILYYSKQLGADILLSFVGGNQRWRSIIKYSCRYFWYSIWWLWRIYHRLWKFLHSSATGCLWSCEASFELVD